MSSKQKKLLIAGGLLLVVGGFALIFANIAIGKLVVIAGGSVLGITLAVKGRASSPQP